MWYLKGSVSGEAAQLIQHFTTTDDNYESAWKVMNYRYENYRLLVNAFLQKLLPQPHCCKENASSIKALHDTTLECLLGLQGLAIDTTNWDPILLHIFTQHLDRTTHMLWEQSLQNPREISTMKNFLTFLELRFQSLEALGSKNYFGSNEPTKKLANQGRLNALITTKTHCIACKQDHPLYRCTRFLGMAISQRLRLVQAAKLCVNCFKNDHKAKQCSSGNCNKCQQRHNTLLHLEPASNQQGSNRTQQPNTTATNQEINSATTRQASSLAAIPAQRNSSVLLSTVSITIEDCHGNQINCRAVLDNGSQINLVTRSFVKKLGIKPTPHHVNIHGIAQSHSKASERVNLKFPSKW